MRALGREALALGEDQRFQALDAHVRVRHLQRRLALPVTDGRVSALAEQVEDGGLITPLRGLVQRAPAL